MVCAGTPTRASEALSLRVKKVLLWIRIGVKFKYGALKGSFCRMAPKSGPLKAGNKGGAFAPFGWLADHLYIKHSHNFVRDQLFVCEMLGTIARQSLRR